MTFQPEQFRERLTELRLRKEVSEYQMSTELGQSKGYIQQISSGRSLPSMSSFFAICDYFSLSPAEFFSMDNHYPLLVQELSSIAQRLDEEALNLLISTAKRFSC